MVRRCRKHGSMTLAIFPKRDCSLMMRASLNLTPIALVRHSPYAFIITHNKSIVQNNKYMAESSDPSLLDEAKALLERNGSLSEAALMIEAAIQKGQLGVGNYEAWILLGETRSMDEQEEVGMQALHEGVRRAVENHTPGPGMMVGVVELTSSCGILTLTSNTVSRHLFHKRGL